MKFEISNKPADLSGEVRLTIDTSREEALEILQSAIQIRSDRLVRETDEILNKMFG